MRQVVLLLGLLLAGVSTAQAEQTITCESEDRRFQRCYIDTRGGVSLTRQLSHAECRYNRDWGYDRQGVWVSNGCRAEFRVRDPGWTDWSGGTWSGHSSGSDIVRCESEGGDYRRCPVDTRGGVRLEHQLSRTACVYHSTWGYNDSGIWVNNGCRADFRIGGSPQHWASNWDSGRASSAGTVTCSSNDGRRSYCRADTRNGVRLSNQLSRSACVHGRTWGYDSGGIWVTDGCRAQFELGGRESYNHYEHHDDDDGEVAAAAAGALIIGAIAAAASQSGAEHRDEARQICQREVEQELRRQQRGISRIEFDEHATAPKVADRTREVKGEGTAYINSQYLPFIYDCRVDMRAKRAQIVDLRRR